MFKLGLELSMAVTIYLNPIIYSVQFIPYIFEQHRNKIQISKSFVYWYLLNIDEVWIVVFSSINVVLSKYILWCQGYYASQ